MTAETIRAKAVRYLGEGRITVHLANAMRVRATAQGTAPYVVEWTRRDGWACSCPSRGFCAHLAGAQLATGRDVATALLRQEVAVDG